MFSIKIPDTYLPEQKYIIRTVFNFFWNLEVSVEPHQKDVVEIKKDSSGGVLHVESALFLTPENQWLTPQSLPVQPLMWKTVDPLWDAQGRANEVPVIYGDRKEETPIVQKTGQSVELGIDVFGAAFFMLSRYEEVVLKEKDALDRFPAQASLAWQESFLYRPIINEYLEILWACILYVWPDSYRGERVFSTNVSHDVDAPFKYALFGAAEMGKKVVKEGLKNGFKAACHEWRQWKKVQSNGIDADPFNTFDEIMDINEQNNCRGAFYFITDHTNKSRDGHYAINQPIIKDLLQRVHKRGHEIGLHPSYHSFDDGDQIKKEFERLKKTCKELDITQNKWGGRQHYLRWQTPQTFQNWENAGLDYDSTLTYAGRAGFRCGICYPYPVFNVLTRQELTLIEKPLIVMEASVLDERYMGYEKNFEEAFDYIISLKDQCKRYGGNFTLLWHNNRFANPTEKELYRQILKD